MRVQKLFSAVEKLWGVLLLVGDWWGKGNCREVFLWGLLEGAEWRM